MTKPIIKIHNADTDTVIEREMNDEEFANYELAQEEAKLTDQKMAEAKVKKEALLKRLKITAEEAQLLLS